MFWTHFFHVFQVHKGGSCPGYWYFQPRVYNSFQSWGSWPFLVIYISAIKSPPQGRLFLLLNLHSSSFVYFTARIFYLRLNTWHHICLFLFHYCTFPFVSPVASTMFNTRLVALEAEKIAGLVCKDITRI